MVNGEGLRVAGFGLRVAGCGLRVLAEIIKPPVLEALLLMRETDIA